MSFLLAAVAFGATIIAFLFAGRVYHRPDHPQWLDRDLAVNTVCLGLVSALALSFGALIKTAVVLPLPVWGDAMAVLVTALIVVFGTRYLFRALVGRSARARA